MATEPRWVIAEVPLVALLEKALSPSWTRDPFDRLLAAHSRARRAPLYSLDQRIRTEHPTLLFLPETKRNRFRRAASGVGYPNSGRMTMGRSEGLSQLEQYVLLCLIRLGDEAYGVPIHQEIEERMSRSLSIATVYSALDRLQKDGLITSHLSSPLPERGGRAKRLYRLSPEGATALHRARRVHDSMWEGVELKTIRRAGSRARGTDLTPAEGA